MRREIGTLAGRPVIVGGGIAGLMTALHLAPEPVVLISKAPLGRESSSLLAQGGVAANLGPDDHPALHAADTIAAGDGLCEADVVHHVTNAAEDAIEALVRFGMRFDSDDDGALRLGLEAAHSRRRIVHAAGDGTGRELMRALVAAVRGMPSIAVIEGIEARRLVTHDGAVAGLVVAAPEGASFLPTGRVVIATGGIGGLFFDTTNPLGSFGMGLALAARAGAVLTDLEFIQFHPTALDVPARPMPLVSEAVRGEGAVLIDETGRRFLADTGGELAPRDVVARALAKHLSKRHRVYLDARDSLGSTFAHRFPAIDAACSAARLDPGCEPIPVRPAAHYHMGGIAVDLAGRSSVEGLWACGEAACTGLHGANRLASNSLLEAAVFARCIAESVAGTKAGRSRPSDPITPPLPMADAARVRSIVSHALGLTRNARDLEDAIAALLPTATGQGPDADPTIAALMIAIAAWQRTESRGAHFRTDFPAKADAARRSRLTLEQALHAAGEVAAEQALPLARSA